MPTCADCGKELDEHELDLGFALPDVVFALPPAERHARAVFDEDLCNLDGERFFIRGVAFVPVDGAERELGWGLWAEVLEDVFEWYREMYRSERRIGSHARGHVANTPPGYASLAEQALTLVFQGGTLRPRLVLEPSAHALYLEQSRGISQKRLHEIISGIRPDPDKTKLDA